MNKRTAESTPTAIHFRGPVRYHRNRVPCGRGSSFGLPVHSPGQLLLSGLGPVDITTEGEEERGRGGERRKRRRKRRGWREREVTSAHTHVNNMQTAVYCQTCLLTNMSIDKHVYCQTCLLTNMSTDKHVY